MDVTNVPIWELVTIIGRRVSVNVQINIIVWILIDSGLIILLVDVNVRFRRIVMGKINILIGNLVIVFAEKNVAHLGIFII